MVNQPPQTTPDPAGPAAPRRVWQPDAKDHQTYRWVRFEGKTQDWVAWQLGVNQATVSRIVQRYERWLARAGEREGGRLDGAERLRAQRWLTYERNEVILASALRIANEMEGFADVSKSVISRPLSKPSAEREMRTETAVVDRHGIAARFLRLAFRINMEQLKLVEQDSPPLPAEPSAEELAEEERLDAAIAAELRASQERADARSAEQEWQRRQEEEAMREVARLEREYSAGTKPGPGEGGVEAGWPASATTDALVPAHREQVCSRLGDGDVMHAVHEMHNAGAAETDATPPPAGSCAGDDAAEACGAAVSAARAGASCTGGANTSSMPDCDAPRGQPTMEPHA
jgi:hypothetical protein